MDFLAEYDEMSSIPTKSAVAYKFLDLFKVYVEGDKRGIHWSVGIVDTKQNDEVLIAFKTYLKAKKAQLRKGEKVNHGKIMWFLYEKLLEVGAFDIPTRNEIRGFLDLCEYIVL